MALIGYARVSTVEQETRLQLDALYAAGVHKVYQEKTSSVGLRPELHRALREMLPGDVLVVWKLDRLARSLFDLLSLLDWLDAEGCAFRSLTEPVDTTTPMGIFILQVLGAVAQLERAIIIQRTTAGIQAARSRGVQWGRRHSLSLEQRHQVVELVTAGVPISDVARTFAVSRGAVYNYVSHCGDTFPTKSVGY
jgi:DNA invertase Pin-like site-specific DNA recombinase